MKKIVLCGGGSAGHVIPNIALLPYLKKHYKEIHYIGTNAIEKDIVKNYPEIIFHEIKACKLKRSFSLSNLKIPFVLLSSIRESKKILREIKPNVIFSKGGYASLPVVFAHQDIPVIAHESDYTLGLANKLILRKCKKMCFSFEDTANKYKNKGIFTGSPIRKEITNGNKNKLNLNFDKQKPTILFVGGSLGATTINNTLDDAFDQLIKKYNIIHIAGKNYQQKNKHKNYVCLTYVNNIEDYLDACDMVVSRSGSNAIYEFLQLNKPMLLIPLSKTSSRGDQILNANNFKNNGYAEILLQEELNKDTLINSINNLLQNKNKYIQKMKNTSLKIGNEKIIETILKYEKK